MVACRHRARSLSTRLLYWRGPALAAGSPAGLRSWGLRALAGRAALGCFSAEAGWAVALAMSCAHSGQ